MHTSQLETRVCPEFDVRFDSMDMFQGSDVPMHTFMDAMQRPTTVSSICDRPVLPIEPAQEERDAWARTYNITSQQTTYIPHRRGLNCFPRVSMNIGL